eukprot:GHVO01036982.1.p1 GENE.GHVO01036982.1~~GHVO01036982.1.p1  ORF type:complete len:109 (+),score=9.48 GHVO01036982.1:35-361(+)
MGAQQSSHINGGGPPTIFNSCCAATYSEEIKVQHIEDESWSIARLLEAETEGQLLLQEARMRYREAMGFASSEADLEVAKLRRTFAEEYETLQQKVKWASFVTRYNKS